MENPTSIRSQDLLVLLGALIGVVPTATNTYLASRAERERLVTQRQFDQLRAFATACQTWVALANRITSLAGQYVEGTDPQERGRLLSQIEATATEVDLASAAARAETSLANAIFGSKIQLETDEPEGLPEVAGPDAIENGRKQVTAMYARVIRTLASCRSHTDALARLILR